MCAGGECERVGDLLHQRAFQAWDSECVSGPTEWNNVWSVATLPFNNVQ